MDVKKIINNNEEFDKRTSFDEKNNKKSNQENLPTPLTPLIAIF